jgi:hypothetical protein
MGGELSIVDGHLACRSKDPLPDDLRRAIREERPALMAVLGASADVTLRATLSELRAGLPRALRTLPDEHLLTLASYAILLAWTRRRHRAV